MVDMISQQGMEAMERLFKMSREYELAMVRAIYCGEPFLMSFKDDELVAASIKPLTIPPSRGIL